MGRRHLVVVQASNHLTKSVAVSHLTNPHSKKIRETATDLSHVSVVPIFWPWGDEICETETESHTLYCANCESQLTCVCLSEFSIEVDETQQNKERTRELNNREESRVVAQNDFLAFLIFLSR